MVSCQLRRQLLPRRPCRRQRDSAARVRGRPSRHCNTVFHRRRNETATFGMVCAVLVLCGVPKHYGALPGRPGLVCVLWRVLSEWGVRGRNGYTEWQINAEVAEYGIQTNVCVNISDDGDPKLLLYCHNLNSKCTRYGHRRHTLN